MLRLIHGGARAVPPMVPRIGLLALDDDLASYVEKCLFARWPTVSINRFENAEQTAVGASQIVISNSEPDSDPAVPTLWLSDVERRCRAVRVHDRLWKCATPISALQLVRVVEHMMRE